MRGSKINTAMFCWKIWGWGRWSRWGTGSSPRERCFPSTDTIKGFRLWGRLLDFGTGRLRKIAGGWRKRSNRWGVELKRIETCWWRRSGKSSSEIKIKLNKKYPIYHNCQNAIKIHRGGRSKTIQVLWYRRKNLQLWLQERRLRNFVDIYVINNHNTVVVVV